MKEKETERGRETEKESEIKCNMKRELENYISRKILQTFPLLIRFAVTSKSKYINTSTIVWLWVFKGLI